MSFYRPIRAALGLATLLLAAAQAARADDGYDLWLRYPLVSDATRLAEYRGAVRAILVQGTSPTLGAARAELVRGLKGLLGLEIPLATSPAAGAVIVGTPASSRLVATLNLAELKRLGREGYLLRAITVRGKPAIVIAANTDIGALYGTFAFLRQLQTHASIARLAVASAPKLELRMLDHWDNLNGTVERGYAGRSIWKWAELPGTLDPRYTDYARADASIGINAAAITNVNAPAQILTAEYLPKVAAIANVLRPYGIRVFLTARFSAPVEIGGLKTADPLDPAVQAWWKRKANEIYGIIPDFGGFLVKANSEGQPGPRDYHRTHAEGANVIADAVAPHHGVVMWRAFVYSNETPTDRVKQAYDEFTPLDGQFRPNVFVQAKNGPLDFQPREPFHPLFGAMPRTPLMMELQITKEYLGQTNSLAFLAPMWKEVLDAETYAYGPASTVARILDGTLTHYPHTGIAGVSNVGDDRNWCGSDFNQANWYAFGRLAWDHDLTSAAIADEWIRMTFSNDPGFVGPVKQMMLASREAVVDYMTPLGLAHQMATGHHYGPGPWIKDLGRADWTPVYYNRADSLGIGFDRTASGSNAVAEYHSPLRERFASRDSVPENLLLWFHHVGWKERMPSGRTLWDELVHRYDVGVESVRWMQRTWDAQQGKIDEQRFKRAQENLKQELKEAKWWRDASVLYFQTFSRMPLPAGAEPPAHTLDFYEHLRCPTDPVHPRCDLL